LPVYSPYGQYEALFTKVIFAEFLFYALVTAVSSFCAGANRICAPYKTGLPVFL